MADAFCRQSRARVDDLFRQLSHSTDASDRELARAVLAGKVRWLERGVMDPSEGTGPWIAETSPRPSTRENLRRRYR